MDMAPLRIRLILIFTAALFLCVTYIIINNGGHIDDNSDKGQSWVHIARDPSSRKVLQDDSANNINEDDQHIDAKDQYIFTYDLGGYNFDQNGRTANVKYAINTSLIHSFSPYIEQETAKRFVDPAHSQVYYANSPAVKWYKGNLFMVSRIWLERERYEPKQDWPANHFADNWLYTQSFDRHMTPVTNGSILGIPTPKQWWVGDGPIEPRVCVVKNRLFITFNAAMAYQVGKYIDYTIIWDYEQAMPIIPKIVGGSPMVNATAPNDMPRDKHWMALIKNDELYFVHNLDPLRVLHCTLQGHCKFVHNEQDKQKGLIFDDHISHLRGGTPFEVYQYPYYISVAHATMYKKSNHHRYYSTHIVVICVEPTFRIVYVSSDVRINPIIYELIPIVRSRYIDDGFIFPVGLIIEDKDTIILGVHISDYSSVLIRVRGIDTIMSHVIKEDIKSKPISGPPIRYLHKHIHTILQNETGIHFSEK